MAALSVLKGARNPLKLSEIAHLAEADIAERSLRRWLVKWVEQGIVVRSGQKRSTRYIYQHKHPYPVALNNGFLAIVPEDRRAIVLEQIRDLWTHTSTAIEGNSLSLGDTHAILAMGLTISGKLLSEHQEIVGHAKAIDILYQSLHNPLDRQRLFDLHRTVQTEIVHDIYQPVGAWKNEKNGAYSVSSASEQVYIEYANPSDVDTLMGALIRHINQLPDEHIGIEDAAYIYAKVHMGFVHIHPFFDGNGRMARLIANLPLLKAGLPPLLINQSLRQQYISYLADYQLAVGKLDKHTGVWPADDKLNHFAVFCQRAYAETKNLLQAHVHP